MTRHQRGKTPTEFKWTGWPTELRQRMLAILATTRCAWSPQLAAGAPAVRASARRV